MQVVPEAVVPVLEEAVAEEADLGHFLVVRLVLGLAILRVKMTVRRAHETDDMSMSN